MNIEQCLNTQVVEDAAALLFWTLSDQVGIHETNDMVLNTEGRCLLKQSFSQTILNQYGFDILSKLNQQEYIDAIANEAERFSLAEENMIGTIFIEDVNKGRAPSAQSIDTSILKKIPKMITNSEKIETIGQLCLRHPLPAIVFSQVQPQESIIRVVDTVSALGFQLDMFLLGENYQKIDDNMYVLTGIFHIPVPDIDQGHLWGKVIQNSSRFTKSIMFAGESSIEINVDW